MKREELQKLGLSDEQVDKVIALHGADVEKTKAGNEALTQTNESLQKQLQERDKDLKGLKKQAEGNEELSNQYKDLQVKYKQDTENLSKALTQTKLNSAVDNALTSAKVRNPKAAKALLDMDQVKLNDQGQLEGLGNQISSLQKTDSYLFDEGKQSHYDPKGGNGSNDSNPVAEMTNIFRGENK